MKRQEEFKSKKLPEYKDPNELKKDIVIGIMNYDKIKEALENLRFEFRKTQEILNNGNLTELKREKIEFKVLELIYKIGDKEKESEILKEKVLENLISYIKTKRQMHKDGLIKVKHNDPDYYIYNEKIETHKVAEILYKNLSCYIKAQGY